jgi:hypothetical protein
MNVNRYILGNGLFGRWILLQQTNQKLAWSGSRWVPIGGDVQLCNFDSAEAAHFYASEVGLEPAVTVIGRNLS